jgi:hypothetical protein
MGILWIVEHELTYNRGRVVRRPRVQTQPLRFRQLLRLLGRCIGDFKELMDLLQRRKRDGDSRSNCDTSESR